MRRQKHIIEVTPLILDGIPEKSSNMLGNKNNVMMWQKNYQIQCPPLILDGTWKKYNKVW